MVSCLDHFPLDGELVWIGLRTERGAPLTEAGEVRADVESGLEGDRHSGSSGRRQVTILQSEHLQVISALTDMDVTPQMLRRNLVVRGINILAFRNSCFSIGEVVLEMTGLCHPCSKMERVLGSGGLNAMRGHGGLTATIRAGGRMRVGDPVRFVSR